MGFFREKGYKISKRAEVLGEISKNSYTIAIAGTHGKTTVTTMTAHLLKQSHVDCSAFLGGISKNYESNLLVGQSNYTVVEADEFDRSFHRLEPQIAIVTSLDADHLDIYGDRETMIAAYNEFCSKVRKGGKLIVNSRIRDRIIVPEGVECMTYGINTKATIRSFNIRRDNEFYSFSIDAFGKRIDDLHFLFPGMINIENFTAAIGAALICGVNEQEIRQAVFGFRGVRRRFDIRINQPGLAYIDDYAHHPEEIRACITSVREYFSGRHITGIFQPLKYSTSLMRQSSFQFILQGKNLWKESILK
jgi:UDP-N-acetylmuramate--alanine ligase